MTTAAALPSRPNSGLTASATPGRRSQPVGAGASAFAGALQSAVTAPTADRVATDAAGKRAAGPGGLPGQATVGTDTRSNTGSGQSSVSGRVPSARNFGSTHASDGAIMEDQTTTGTISSSDPNSAPGTGAGALQGDPADTGTRSESGGASGTDVTGASRGTADLGSVWGGAGLTGASQSATAGGIPPGSAAWGGTGMGGAVPVGPVPSGAVPDSTVSRGTVPSDTVPGDAARSSTGTPSSDSGGAAAVPTAAAATAALPAGDGRPGTAAAAVAAAGSAASAPTLAGSPSATTAAGQSGQWGTATIAAGPVSGAALIAAQASLSESAAAAAVVSGAPAAAAIALSSAGGGIAPAAASAASPSGRAGTPAAATADEAGSDGTTPPTATPASAGTFAFELAGTSAPVDSDGAAGTVPASAAVGSTAPGETAPGATLGQIAPVPSPGALTGASVPSVSTATTPSTPPAPLASQVARPLFSLAAAGPGEHTLSISVTPDNLGPVLVRAQISAGGVRLELFAPTELARDALRQILPDLRRDLAGGGLPASLDLSTRSQPGDAGSNGRCDRPAPDFSAQAGSSLDGDARGGASRDPSPDPWLRASPTGPDSADPANRDTDDSAGAGSPRGRVDVLA